MKYYDEVEVAEREEKSFGCGFVTGIILVFLLLPLLS
jgi:hypothetical protein